jgi:hypothetical protein
VIFNISSRDLLYDLFYYLKNNGFVVGKIYPRYVDFFDYHFEKENFMGNNYLAVSANETVLINELKRFSKGGKI